MDVKLENNFYCIESDVYSLMQDIKTPLSYEDLRKSKYEDSYELDVIDRSLRISAARWGTVYGYEQEQGGIAVQNLFPVKRDENSQVSSSSNVDLELHTETAFHPLRPDVLCLLCVRGDPNAGTVYVLLDDILEQLSSDIIVLLHLPMYYTTIDESFLSKEQDNKEIDTAILFDSATRIVYDRALMGSRSEMGKEALKLLSAAIDRCKRTVYLETGDMLKIDNRRVIHGRTQFTPRYDGTDRWIKRVMVLARDVHSDHRKITAAGTRLITTKL